MYIPHCELGRVLIHLQDISKSIIHDIKDYLTPKQTHRQQKKNQTILK